MSDPFNAYDAITGQLVGQTFSHNVADSTFAAALVLANTPAGCAMYEGPVPDRSAQRIDIASGLPVGRGACPITAAVAARVVTLSGVPAGAAYTLSGDAALSGTCDASGTLALTFGAAGTYTVTIACFPLLDYSGSFTLA
jgi:hypothetical protein